MKKKFTKIAIAILSSVIIMSSCNQHGEEVTPYLKLGLSKQKANLAAGQFLILENNQYKLELDEDHAFELGISRSDYEKMIAEVSETNALILEMQDNPKVDIELMDPKDLDCIEINIKKDSKSPLLKTRSETSTGPSGTISMSGQGEVSTSIFWLPRQYKGFSMILTGAALTPVYAITTAFLADKVYVKVGVAGVWSGKVAVNGSGCYGLIKCKTTDSNGASGSYAAVTSID